MGTNRFWIPDSASTNHQNTDECSTFCDLHSGRTESEYHNENQQSEEIDDEGTVWHLHLDSSAPESQALLKYFDGRGNGVSKSRKRRRMQIKDRFMFAKAGGEEDTSGAFDNVEGDDEFVIDGGSLSETDDIEEDIDEVYNATNVTAEVELGASSSRTSNTTEDVVFTRVDADEDDKLEYRPIRIRAILSEQASGGQFLDDEERSFLFEEILTPAILAWSSALRVVPVEGNLTVDKNQLYDGVSCGPGLDSGFPSVVVPERHFNEGIAGTDFIVYLSLGFVADDSLPEEEQITTGDLFQEQSSPSSSSSSSPIDSIWNRVRNKTTWVLTKANETTWTATNKTEWTSTNETNLTTKETNLTTTNGTSQAVGDYEDENYRMHEGSNTSLGVLDTLLETGKESISNATTANDSTINRTKPGCSGEFLAASTYCSTDQYDRPTTALLHICIGQDFFEESSIETNIVTVMHELGHSLGFNLQSMAHFRDEKGDPLTPRAADGNVVDVEVECTGPTEQRGSAVVPLPSKEILNFSTVRGGRVAQVVTPLVRQVVRNHFNCQDLDGAELENGNIFDMGGGEISSCIGNHWERRLFRTDLMNPIVSEVPFVLRISPITLALFADSGWYQVDVSRASFASGWGRAAGCSFVDEPCVGKDGLVSPKNKPFFCTDTVLPESRGGMGEMQGCSPDMSSKAVCSLGRYDDPLPGVYQYFGSTLGSNVAGNEPYIDFCPVYQGFANGNCKDADNAASLRIVSNEDIGSRNSRCLGGRFGATRTALCMQIACVLEDQLLYVKVNREWHKCTRGGQPIEFKSGSWGGTVYCPDPIRTCPTFYCNRDCLGTGGRCDYNTGECVCTFNLTNTTEAEGKCGNETTETVVSELQGSPLIDYYVQETKDLEGYKSNRRYLFLWIFSSLACVGIGLLLLVLWGSRAKLMRSRNRQGTAEVEMVPRNENRSNKDKFVATLLFHIRVHDPRNEAAEAASTTMETDSSGHLPSFSASDFDSTSEIDESIYSFVLEEIQPGATGQLDIEEDFIAPCTIRRRMRTEDAWREIFS